MRLYPAVTPAGVAAAAAAAGAGAGGHRRAPPVSDRSYTSSMTTESSVSEVADHFGHVKHCTTHPKFLHSNSTSHRWVFGAIAELIDNAIDPDVSASQFCIDMKEFNNEPCLVFMDNGSGLTPERLHKMLSFGHSKKQLTPGDRSIGKHGNGFKSGTMRLGKDVLVLTKCSTSMTAGFLSQSFLLDTGAEDILIPQVSWDLDGNRLGDSDLDADESLAAICNYSIFPDEDSLLAQLEAIPLTGAILIISNLRRHEGHLELDFETDPHDIRITSELNNSNFQQLRPNQPNSVDVATDYSLRAYVSILYKVPRMQIFIRDKKVKTKRISGLLSMKETETYKPVGSSEILKIELGFNTDNKNLYGMMLYHRNRLIKPYMRVGIQLEENERGMGVIGIVEADFLQPTHNKQDFDDTITYRRLLKKLSEVLAEYWWEKKERNTTALVQVEPRLKRPGQNSSPEDVPDVVWVQCDNPSCLKWRVLPHCSDPASLPDIWYCDYHPDARYRRHEEPEQEWDASIPHEIVERRKERKREYDREKREREAQKKRQRLDAVSREEHVNLQKQKDAIQRDLEEALAKEKMLQEQERRRQEEEVKKLNEECLAMKAKQQEMLEKQLELQQQLKLANEERARQEELARQNQHREEQEALARQERERQEYEEQQELLARERHQQEELAKQHMLKVQEEERARQEKERLEYEAHQEEVARLEREREEIELQKEEAARIQRAFDAQQQELQRQERLRQQEYEEQQEEAVRQARVRQEYNAHQQRELVRQRQDYGVQQEDLVRQEYTRRQEEYERTDRLRQEFEAHMSAKDQSQDRTGLEGHSSEDHLTLGLVTQYGMPEGLEAINDLQDSSLQAEDLLQKGSQRQKNMRDQQLLVANQGLDKSHRGQPNAIQHHQYMLPDAMHGAQELQLIDSNSLSETLMTRAAGSQQTNKTTMELAALRPFGSRVPSAPQGTQQSHGDLLKQMAANGMSMSVPQRYDGAERQTSTPRGLPTSALMPPTPSPTHMSSFASVNSSLPGQVPNNVRATSAAAPISQHFRQSMAPKQGTAQAVAPFQEMSLQPVAVNDSSMYESRVQQALYSNRVEAETQQAGQFSGLSTVTTRGDLNDQQGSGAGFYGRPGDAQPSGMVSAHLPLESGLSNASSTTDTSLDQVVFVLQRRLRVALNTLEKIGGALEPSLLEMNGLPSTDLEVVSICEKARNLVEKRTQAFRDEIARLKAQLAFFTSSNPQGSVDKPRNYNF